MKTIIYNNIPIIFGKNAQENWDLLSKNPNFTWLHLKSFLSCHVIIESTSISPNLLKYAANTYDFVIHSKLEYIYILLN